MGKEEENLNRLSRVLDGKEEIDLTLSYSKLSDFDRNGAISLIRKKHLDGDGVKIGSLVDDLLFLDDELFESKYYIFDGDKPSATLGALCDIITSNYTEIPSKQEVKTIAETNGFWSNIKKDDIYISKFNTEEFWNYIEAIFKTNEREIITSSEYKLASELVDILKNHKYSRDILNNKLENYYQVKFNFGHKGFKIRGIIDILSIDHENKKVYMIDLKTGKNSSAEFEDSFIKWRYYFQGALYSLAFEEICKELKIEGYKLEPFQFLYISKTEKIPLLFKMTDKWIKAAFDGFNIGKYEYRGINSLIDEIYWCWKNKQYTIPRRIIENNGVVELKDNFIKVYGEE